MTKDSYADYFKKATGNEKPFDFQIRLAGGDAGSACQSLLIDVPTGLGKTAAAIIAWLWNRVHLQRADWPRRLVYCLPMRTLVEQTHENVRKWLHNLEGLEWNPGEAHTGKVGLHVLMGGEEREKDPWDLYPEENAILIGTQDMLLSRALNRGYAMSRYRWPMHFALLNNDCLWVFDEVQLMGNGLFTGIQLDAFRSGKLWSTAKPCPTWWMSATQSPDSFDTTDRKELGLPRPEVFQLTTGEQKEVKGRLHAEKHLDLRSAPPKSSEILAAHREGQMTLVITNTVRSAIHWYLELSSARNAGNSKKRRKEKPSREQKLPAFVLLHSRFRLGERKQQIELLNMFLSSKEAERVDHPGIILVSTQVIEAGIDISAAMLWSEIAPWSSTIQRLGRLNRDGKQKHPANASFWMPKEREDEDTGESKTSSRIGPYDKAALNAAESLLRQAIGRQATGTGYREALNAVLATEESKAALAVELNVAIRSDDAYGLFSSEPDLAGGFTNISPFVRSTREGADVTVFWREVKGHPSSDVQSATSRQELVHVPVYILTNFLREHHAAAFLWNEEIAAWSRAWPNEIVPGMTLLLPVSAGGYSSQLGFTGNPNDVPETLEAPESVASSLFADRESETEWQTLAEHTAAVAKEADAIARELSLPEDWINSLSSASEWHDVGKAHPRWQNCLPPHPTGVSGPWGKFSGHFTALPKVRHEALSLMAAWQCKMEGSSEITALSLYLIASHHGKVRTLLRSANGSDVFGWQESDSPLMHKNSTYPIDVTVRSFAAAAEINWITSEYRILRYSWASLIQELLGPAWITDAEAVEALGSHEPRRLGPFNLAYIESVFRAADARASRRRGAL